MNWIAIVVAAVCGGLGGGLGGALTHRLKEGASAKRIVPGVLGIMAVVLGNNAITPKVSEWWADARARTPYEKFERAYAKLIASDHEIGSYVRSIEQRPGITPEQARAEAHQTTARGIARLSESDLFIRAEILAKGLNGVDETTCAQIARGDVSPVSLRKLLDATTDVDAVAFASIVAASWRAEIRRSPPSRSGTTEQDAERVGEALARVITEEEIAAIARAFDPAASDAEVCSGVRRLYRNMPALAPETRVRAALMLSGL